MDIGKAVSEAYRLGKCITNSSFPDTKIKPTNDKGNCIVMYADGKNPSKYGWQPTAEDLMRRDWVVVD